MLGVDTSVGGGVSMVNGALTVTGNSGQANDLTLETSDILVNQTFPSAPLIMNKTQAADGESVRTEFITFDSLGSTMTLDLTVVLEGKSNAGTQWRYYVQSEDDSDLDRVLGSGLLSFDTNGELTTLYSNTTLFGGTGFDPIVAGWTLVPSPSTLAMVVLGGSVVGLDRHRRVST